MAPVHEDDRGGHDVEPDGSWLASLEASTPAQVNPAVGRGEYSGVWLSRYEYYSSGREALLEGAHFVVVLQHGDKLAIRSLPGTSDSTLTMDLTMDRNIVTGTWVEQTAPSGYYQGAKYHGAMQLLIEPTGRRMVGKWVGFGKRFDVNTGPWELVFRDGSTSKSVLAKYSCEPGGESARAARPTGDEGPRQRR